MNRRIGVIFSYVLIVSEAVFSLVLTPYIIRMLGQGEYGVYKLNETITSYLLLLDLGVGHAVVRWIAEYRTKGDKRGIEGFLGLSTLFYLGVSLLTIVGGYTLIILCPHFLAEGLSPSELLLEKKLLSITTINAAITIGTVPFVNTIVGYERFVFSKCVSIGQIIIRSIFFYAALMWGFGSVGLAVAQLIITIIARLITMIYVFGVLNIHLVFKVSDRNVITEVVSYSALFFLLTISTQINNSLDNVLLAVFVPNASRLIAIYSVALQITYYFISIGNGMTNVLMPGVVRMVENGASNETLCKEMIRIGRIVLSFAALLLVGFFVCGKRFIFLWVGNEYVDAFYISFPLLIVYMFMTSQGIGDDILCAKKKIKEYTIIRTAVLVINIGLSLLLIRWNPICGVMIGTLISLVLGCAFASIIMYKKHIELDLKLYFKELLSGILPVVFLTGMFGSLVSYFINEDVIGLIILIVIISFIYFVLLWNMGLKQYEKDYYVGVIKSFIRQ